MLKLSRLRLVLHNKMNQEKVLRFLVHCFIFCNQIKQEKTPKFLRSSLNPPQKLTTKKIDNKKKRKNAEISPASLYPLSLVKHENLLKLSRLRLVLHNKMNQEKVLRFLVHCFIFCNQIKQEKTPKFLRSSLNPPQKLTTKKMLRFHALCLSFSIKKKQETSL